MKLVPILALSLATVGLVAQTQTKPQLSDKKMEFALWFKEASTEFPDKTTIVFEVSGNPVKGYSKSQNLNFSSAEMSGTILQLLDEKTKIRFMRLKSGKMTGNAVLNVTDTNGETEFKSNQITIVDTGETATVTVPGSLSVSSSAKSETSSRTMTMSGTGGQFVLKSLQIKDPDPFTSGNIDGPITLKVNQSKSGDKVSIYTLSGDKLSAHSEGENKVIKITGKVHISSDTTDDEGKGFVGEMNVSQATVTFDKNLNLIKMVTNGSPGSGQVKEKIKKDSQ